ncbi:MAG TPA: bifunctional diaminohydroxyphosphoribosylaminopyrimidine deaminase/5-amino-6-(5-phosphoribosylamino)uracil reductase RibD, partial [Thermoanaerobaculia bacterium]|nr:bifunctional diaminohydroxyphosphoribosylaminopyrimidine deaminase/5-amino-6-(5-phosphoribosylamino)uracil reductase RibD [Thermoanaerobaculia bacterium]
MERHTFMKRALELAEKGRYTASPNPMVGCVIVRDGEIVGEGFHQRAGEPHAEVEALRACNGSPEGCDVYVTLEPCAHFGRTPPCADALIEARVGRVLVATGDPHPDVDGRGLARLRDAGIAVEVGLEGSEARRLNEKFLYSARTKRPFILIKAGMTLDGKLASVARKSRWITSPESRRQGLLLREEFDAILVGSGTVQEDDPELTRRLGLAGERPWTRIVVDATGDLPKEAKILADGGRTIVFTSSKFEPSAANVEAVRLPSSRGRLDLEQVLRETWARGIRSIVVEGGSLLHSEIITRNLWQKMILFVAPMVVGGASAPSIFAGEGVGELADAHRFRFDRFEKIGPDLMVVAYPLIAE